MTDEQKKEAIIKLREETGKGHMECKLALNACDYKHEDALTYIKEHSGARRYVTYKPL